MPSGTTLGTGYVQIEPTAKGISGKVQKVLSPEMDSAGNKSGASLGSAIASSMTKYISAAAIGSGIAKSLTEGAALEQSLGGVETLFKTSADTVIQNANEAWRTAGLSANEYMEQSTSFAASLLQSLGGDTKKAAQYADTAIIDMADNANKMGTAVESIQNAYQGFAKQNYTMLDNLKLGYGGTKTEMERLLADAGAIAGVEYDISSLSDVYEAIHVIQGELGITGTTSKEAAETLSGSMAAMKSAATDFLGNLSMRPKLVEKSMKNLAKATSTFLFDNLVPAMGNILKSLSKILGSLMTGDFVGKLIKNLYTVSKKLLSGSTVFVQNGLDLLVKLANGIAKGMPALITYVPKIVGNIADVINRNAPKILAAGIKIIGVLAKGMVQSIPTLVKSIPSILKAAAKVFTAFSWASLGRTVVTGIGKGIANAAGSIGSKVTAIINKIKGFFPFSVGKIFSNFKLPKIIVSGGKAPWGIGGLGKKPAFDVKWNAEGGIFNRASIIGYGVGEAGREAILPLDPFWKKLDTALNNGANGNGGVLNLVITLDGETIAKSTVDYVNGQTLRYGTSPLMV